MVCPVDPKRIRPKVNANECRPAAHPDEIVDLMDALRSPDPTVRREAARLMEVGSLAALNAAEMWRTDQRD